MSVVLQAELGAQKSAAQTNLVVLHLAQLAAGVQDFMNPDILKTAKLWRFQKLSRGELVGLVQHYTQVTPPVTATKAQLIKSLMDVAVGMQ